MLAHGYQGAFHLWRRVEEGDESAMELWKPIHAPSGHFGPVQVCVATTRLLFRDAGIML